ncbi:thrombopoietin receptor [Xyrichtys novacula]|uniref:Thrombopoietin receptor n=1 Tax=Xyrichtys novacula TaxID=13765 RepID=A0AAV1FK78_XYRNO|nr:thrombopoietin receptor [Xyrichtys novacula]
MSAILSIRKKCKIKLFLLFLQSREECLLDQLVPGEEVKVQVRVKCAYNPDAGHWSGWSQPLRAVVPQSADDVSLMCFTSDLENFTCEWNGSRSDDQNEFKLSYQMSHSDALGWTDWTECLADWDLIDQCRFYGNQSRGVRVKLTSPAGPLSRTFYTDKFTLKKSIKTPPPSHVKAALEEDKLCLRWEAPLVSLSAHLQYEVGYQIRESEDWMTRRLNGPETSTCLGVPLGRHFSVKLRAKPDGSVYSGLWSDWSDVLTGDTPTDRGLLLILFVPVSVLLFAVILIFIFYSYHRKLKQYFWPPVPNLDKVLQGYLTEIKGQKWDPPIPAKQCFEETTSSLVEIMFADEISGSEKPSGESTQLLRSSDNDLPDLEPTNEKRKSEEFPDYVTLNKDSVILCPKGNTYVYEQIGEKERLVIEKELLQKCQSLCSESVFIPACQDTNFLNHSYLAVAEPAERFDSEVTAVRGSGNIYTNLPCG